jgi:hypothetical protein
MKSLRCFFLPAVLAIYALVAAQNPVHGAQVTYIAPSGNDTNSGGPKTPLATLNAAAKKLNGRGTIIVQPGIYTNATGMDCSNAVDREIVGRVKSGSHPVFLFGTALTEWTPLSNGIYYASIDYLTNLALLDFKYIFEYGTPKNTGPIDKRRVLQGSGGERFDHYPLLLQRRVDLLSEGTWFSTPTNVYVKFSDGGPPNGRTVYVSSQNPSAGFLYGGTGTGSVSVSRIEADFGYQNFDFSGTSSFEAFGCKAVGSYSENFAGISPWTGAARLSQCESMGSNNDGFGYAGNNHVLERQCWSHDNADDGTSPHFGTQLVLYDGLYDRNKASGITAFAGASVTAFRCQSLANLMGVCVAGWTPGPDGATRFTGDRMILQANFIGLYMAPGDVGLFAKCNRSVFRDLALEIAEYSYRDADGRGQYCELTFCEFGSTKIFNTGAEWQEPVITPPLPP